MLTRSAGLGFFVRKGVFIVRYILLIMLHGIGDTALHCPLGIESDIRTIPGAKDRMCDFPNPFENGGGLILFFFTVPKMYCSA